MNYVFTLSLAALLIAGSAVCSGLNVALLSLDLRSTRRKAKLGDPHAVRALAIREHVHFYLAGILFTNVAFASGTSVVLADGFSGLVAVLLSTILLVIFAEITPQAIAVSRAMQAISTFAGPIKVVSYAAYPITKPLELLLNKLVGKTAESLHSRHELALIIAEHLGEDAASELDDDEVEIVQNALQLSEKRVKEIMTPLNEVYYMLETDVIDSKKIDELKYENWSRIPIFNKSKTDCHKFVVLKDLVDIDFDEKSYTLDEVKTHKAKTVGSMTALDTMFRKFIAARSHMMIVEKDDRIVGVVTIEDLLEEIIGHEIEDEGDE